MFRKSVVVALAAVALWGCGRTGPSACEGLVYKEAGLGRREYLPCASAMVAELDQFHRALKTMGDQNLPAKDRQRARQGCLAANARLVKLIRQAGGSQKLVHTTWEDTALNELNRNIMAAQNAYLMYCYYGPNTASHFDLAQEDSSHAEARRELSALR